VPGRHAVLGAECDVAFPREKSALFRELLNVPRSPAPAVKKYHGRRGAAVRAVARFVDHHPKSDGSDRLIFSLASGNLHNGVHRGLVWESLTPQERACRLRSSANALIQRNFVLSLVVISVDPIS
jgi:hypothetical protein